MFACMFFLFLPERRIEMYILTTVFTRATLASAGTSMARCLSVCLSITSRCSVETDGRIELVFGMKASLDLTHTHTVFNKIQITPKIRVFPSGTLF